MAAAVTMPRHPCRRTLAAEVDVKEQTTSPPALILAAHSSLDPPHLLVQGRPSPLQQSGEVNASHAMVGKVPCRTRPVLEASPPAQEAPLSEVPPAIEVGLAAAHGHLGGEAIGRLYPPFAARRGRPDWASLNRLTLEQCLSTQPAASTSDHAPALRSAPWNSSGRRVLRRLLPALALARVSAGELARATPTWRLHFTRLLQLAAETSMRDAAMLARAVSEQQGVLEDAGRAQARAAAASSRAEALAQNLREELAHHRETLARMHRMLQAAVTASGTSAPAVEGAVAAYITSAYRRLAAQEAALTTAPLASPLGGHTAVPAGGGHPPGSGAVAAVPTGAQAGGPGAGGACSLRVGVDWEAGVAHAAVPAHACPHCRKVFTSLAHLDAHAKRRHIGLDLPSTLAAQRAARHEAEAGEVLAAVTAERERILQGQKGLHGERPTTSPVPTPDTAQQEEIAALRAQVSRLQAQLAEEREKHAQSSAGPAPEALVRQGDDSSDQMSALLEAVRRNAKLEAEAEAARAAAADASAAAARARTELKTSRREMATAVSQAQAQLQVRLDGLLAAHAAERRQLQGTIDSLRRDNLTADARVAVADAATATARADAVEARVTREAAAAAARTAAAAARKQLVLASSMARAYILASLFQRWYRGQLDRGLRAFTGHARQHRAAEVAALIASHQQRAAQLQARLTSTRIQHEALIERVQRTAALRRARLSSALLPHLDWRDPSAVEALTAHYLTMTRQHAAELQALAAAEAAERANAPSAAFVPTHLVVRGLEAEVQAAAAAAERRAASVAARWWRRAHADAVGTAANPLDLQTTGAWDVQPGEVQAACARHVESVVEASDARRYAEAAAFHDAVPGADEAAFLGIDGRKAPFKRPLAPLRPWIVSQFHHTPAAVRAAAAGVDARVAALTEQAVASARAHLGRQLAQKEGALQGDWWRVPERDLQRHEKDPDNMPALPEDWHPAGVEAGLFRQAVAEAAARTAAARTVAEPAASLMPLLEHAANVITARHCPAGDGGDVREGMPPSPPTGTPAASLVWEAAMASIKAARSAEEGAVSAEGGPARLVVGGALPGVRVAPVGRRAKQVPLPFNSPRPPARVSQAAALARAAHTPPPEATPHTSSGAAHTPQRHIVSPSPTGIRFQGPMQPEAFPHTSPQRHTAPSHASADSQLSTPDGPTADRVASSESLGSVESSRPATAASFFPPDSRSPAVARAWADAPGAPTPDMAPDQSPEVGAMESVPLDAEALDSLEGSEESDAWSEPVTPQDQRGAVGEASLTPAPEPAPLQAAPTSPVEGSEAAATARDASIRSQQSRSVHEEELDSGRSSEAGSGDSAVSEERPSPAPSASPTGEPAPEQPLPGFPPTVGFGPSGGGSSTLAEVLAEEDHDAGPGAPPARRPRPEGQSAPFNAPRQHAWADVREGEPTTSQAATGSAAEPATATPQEESLAAQLGFDDSMVEEDDLSDVSEHDTLH